MMTLALLAVGRFAGGRLRAVLPLWLALCLSLTVAMTRALVTLRPPLFAATTGTPDFDELRLGGCFGRGFR